MTDGKRVCELGVQMSTKTDPFIKGGGFLLESPPIEDVFTPEDFTEEQRMIAETAARFMETEVVPRIGEMESKQEGVNEKLMRKAAEIGLVSAGIPQAYGGEGLDQISVTIITEKSGRYGSFATTFSAHTGIGILPLVYFGTEAQKQQYLPKLATAEWIAAYALTEAEAGSDALNARTKAVLNPEGTHYLLNGTKCWITNAGFANLFVTFAKVDGDKFSCFLIEREFPGVSTGQEEQKMGIQGSSTRTLILENAQVPRENLLGEIGKGHKIAFNILNIGRFKLGASVLEAIRWAENEAIRYAKQRVQFGKPIITFGAIQHKLAEMAVRVYCAESMVYRTAGMLDGAMRCVDPESLSATADALKMIEEYAVECSIIKVASTEILDFVVDEGVQVFGGNGYSREYPIERAYRDARINRIFEGTNEVNRLLITGQLLKRAMKGQLGLFHAGQKLMDEILSPTVMEEDADGPLIQESRMVGNAKKMFLLAIGVATLRFRDKISEEQEVLCLLSDLVIEIYAMESVLLRVLKGIERDGLSKWGLPIKAAKICIHGKFPLLENQVKQILAAVSVGDELRIQLAALRRFTKSVPIDLIALRREIAQALNDAGKYCLNN
jgi:alkylation response protein AidB-like acyl-CoA dehydrogenase